MIIRLHKTDLVAVQANAEMALAFVNFDGVNYNFTWTGRGGILPQSAVEKGINVNNRTRDMRQILIATDGETWTNNDRVNIITKTYRQGRVDPSIVLSHKLILLGVGSPNDQVAFQITDKAKEYWIDVFINPLSEGEYGFPEVPRP